MNNLPSPLSSKNDKVFLSDCISSLRCVIGRYKNSVLDSYLVSYISLTDAVKSLEEGSITAKKISKPRRVKNQRQAVLLAHFTLERKFRQRHIHAYQSQERFSFFKPFHF